MKYKCDICKDKGVVEADTPSGYRTCSCIVEANLKEYIGIQYMQYNFNREQKSAQLHQNLYFENKPMSNFGSIVKSYLAIQYLKNGTTEWVSINGSDIIEDWLEDGSHTYYYTVPFLILKLGNDYNNKQLGPMVLNTLLRRLEQPNLITWIYTLPGIKPDDIIQEYGIEVQSLITNKQVFKKVK